MTIIYVVSVASNREDVQSRIHTHARTNTYTQTNIRTSLCISYFSFFLSIMQAGMSADAVELALEPEGAAFRCRNDLYFAHKELGRPPVLRYVVADCGGGTIDVTIHDLKVETAEKKINEVYRATGGGWGGTMVDKEIYELIDKIIGHEVASKLVSGDWLRFRRKAVEEAKRSVTPGCDKVNLTFTAEMLQAIRDAGGNIEESASRYPGVMYRRAKGALQIDGHLLEKCFKESLDQIVAHLRKIMRDVKGVHCILVVGGYAESEMLMGRMEAEFRSAECRVLRPNKPSMAVVAGAVVSGQNPSIMESRKAKATYGVKILTGYEPDRHREEKMAITPFTGMVARDVFEKYVTVNESVVVGFNIEKTFHPVSPTQTLMTVELYTSPEKDPVHIDDEGCRMLGSVNVLSPNIERGCDRDLLVSMNFGATSLHFKAADITTGTEPKRLQVELKWD